MTGANLSLKCDSVGWKEQFEAKTPRETFQLLMSQKCIPSYISQKCVPSYINSAIKQ